MRWAAADEMFTGFLTNPVRLLASRSVSLSNLYGVSRGFAQAAHITQPLPAPGLGLFGLMDRFQQLNGQVTIQSTPVYTRKRRLGDGRFALSLIVNP